MEFQFYLRACNEKYLNEKPPISKSCLWEASWRQTLSCHVVWTQEKVSFTSKKEVNKENTRGTPKVSPVSQKTFQRQGRSQEGPLQRHVMRGRDCSKLVQQTPRPERASPVEGVSEKPSDLEEAPCRILPDAGYSCSSEVMYQGIYQTPECQLLPAKGLTKWVTAEERDTLLTHGWYNHNRKPKPQQFSKHLQI